MPIEEFVSSVSFDNGDRNGINYLIGGKSLTANGALTAALDTISVINRTGIKNSGID